MDDVAGLGYFDLAKEEIAKAVRVERMRLKIGIDNTVKISFYTSCSYKWEILKGDAPSANQLKMLSSDALQDMICGEELSLYGSAQNNAESAQMTKFQDKASHKMILR